MFQYAAMFFRVCSSVCVDTDGFRNCQGEGHEVPAEHLLIERAFRLTLSAPEMTVLCGGVRGLNDFVSVLDLGTRWKPKTGWR